MNDHLCTVLHCSTVCLRCCAWCREGLYLTIGFFSDIFIPEENLQDNSDWDDKDGHWYWQVRLHCWRDAVQSHDAACLTLMQYFVNDAC